MKRTIFSVFASFLSCFLGAQMLPDSVEFYMYDLTKEEYSETPNSTERFSYDVDGNVIELIVRSGNMSPFRYTYSYTLGKETENIRYEWNPKTSLWFPKERNQVFSNEFGVDTAEVYSVYDTTSQTWSEGGRKVYVIVYDVNDRPLTTTVKVYNSLTQVWTTYDRLEFIYAGMDTIPTDVYLVRWEGGSWVNWLWHSGLKWQLGFNPNPKYLTPTLRTTHMWDSTNWVENDYDSMIVVNGKVEDIFHFRYNKDSQYYYQNTSFHYTFDTYGNETSFIRLLWRGNLSDTFEKFTSEFLYGSQGEVLECISETYRLTFGLMARYKEIYYYGANSLVPAQRIYVNIYPNPIGAAQRLFIQSETSIGQVQLYSGNGAMLRMWGAPDGDGLDIKGIAPGLYFIRLQDVAGNTSTQRLIIK